MIVGGMVAACGSLVHYVRVICLQMSVERAIAKFIELSRVGGKPSAARVSADLRQFNKLSAALEAGFCRHVSHLCRERLTDSC